MRSKAWPMCGLASGRAVGAKGQGQRPNGGGKGRPQVHFHSGTLKGGVRFEFEFGRVAVSDRLGEAKGSAQLVVWPMCGLACAPDSGLGHESEGLGCWEAKPSVKVTKVPCCACAVRRLCCFLLSCSCFCFSMLRVCCADVVRTHLGNFPIGFRKFPHVDFAHLCSHLFFAFNVRKCDCRLACVVSQVFLSPWQTQTMKMMLILALVICAAWLAHPNLLATLSMRVFLTQSLPIQPRMLLWHLLPHENQNRCVHMIAPMLNCRRVFSTLD